MEDEAEEEGEGMDRELVTWEGMEAVEAVEVAEAAKLIFGRGT